MSPAHDIDERCDVAITRLKHSGLAKAGVPAVIMTGSTEGGAPITDTVRMLIVAQDHFASAAMTLGVLR